MTATTSNSRRVKRVQVSPRMFVNLLRGGKFEIEDGIPEDAVYCGFGHDPANDCMWIYIEHYSFPQVPENCEIPNFPRIEIKNATLNRVMPIKIQAGDKVRVRLLASRTLKEDRMSRGVDKDSYEGTAIHDLMLDHAFAVSIGAHDLVTSRVEYIGPTIFRTKNSTYYVEKL